MLPPSRPLFAHPGSLVSFFFLKSSGNHINLFVTDTGFLLSLPSAGLTCFFFLMLFGGRFSFVRQPNQNQLHITVQDEKLKTAAASLNPESSGQPRVGNEQDLEKGWPSRHLGPPWGTWTPDSRAASHLVLPLLSPGPPR